MATDSFIPLDKRLGSMLADRLHMLLINILFFIPFLISLFSNPQLFSHEQKKFGFFFTPWFFLGLLGFAVYLCKDCINGQSAVKRQYKFQVVDNKTGEPATPLQSVIRNLFCVLWPIELIVVQFNTSRRIGDWVADTRLAYKETTMLPSFKIDTRKLILAYSVAFGFLLLLFLPFYSVKVPEGKKIYSQSSYNILESRKIEKIYQDSLGEKLTADIRIYDSIPGHRVRYVSIIFRLKKNYLNTQDMLGFKNSVLEVLYSILPEYSITGKAKFIYQKINVDIFSIFTQMTSSDSKLGVLVDD